MYYSYIFYVYTNIFNINQIFALVRSFSIFLDAIFWLISTKHPCCFLCFHNVLKNVDLFYTYFRFDCTYFGVASRSTIQMHKIVCSLFSVYSVRNKSKITNQFLFTMSIATKITWIIIQKSRRVKTEHSENNYCIDECLEID